MFLWQLIYHTQELCHSTVQLDLKCSAMTKIQCHRYVPLDTVPVQCKKHSVNQGLHDCAKYYHREENTADLRKIVPNGAIGWHEYTSCSHKRRRQMAPQRGATKEDDDDMDVAAVAEGGRAIIRGS